MKSKELTTQITEAQTSLDNLQAEKALLATELEGFDYTQGTAEEAAARLSNLRTKNEILTQRIEVAGNRIKQLNAELIKARRDELTEAMRKAGNELAAVREKIRPKLVALFDYDAEPMIRDVSPIFPSLEKLVDMTADVRKRKKDIEMLEWEIRQMRPTP